MVCPLAEPMVLLDTNNNSRRVFPGLNNQGSIGIAAFSKCGEFIFAGNNKGGVAIIRVNDLKVIINISLSLFDSGGNGNFG